MLVVWTILGALVLTLLLKYLWQAKYNLPPGPTGLPFIGNVFQLDMEKPHETITKWSDQFGDVFKMSAFGRTTVILNSFETIYEGLVTQANKFAGRVNSPRMDIINCYSPDILTSTFTPEWVFRKKITLQTLKMYGDNLDNLEALSIDLINDMIDELKLAANKEPSDIYPIYHKCITSIITSILYGEKGDKETPTKIKAMLDDSIAVVQSTGPSAILDILPFVRHLPNPWSGEISRIGQVSKAIIDPKIKERRTNSEPGFPICFNDGLLDYQRKTKESGTGMDLSDAAMYGINSNLLVAGTFTTSTTLNCLIAVMVNKPEIQAKMYNEIKDEIGDRIPRLTDRKQLNYVEAAILEVLRYSSIITLNVPHCTIEDTKINGYDIPKGTEIFYNLWKLHHDTRYWDEPWEFKPERYLDEDGILVAADHVNRKRLLAFGASRRVCVGESLARNRLFLMVAALLQHFQFLPVSVTEIPRHDPRDYKMSFGIEPHKYRVKLAMRA